MTTTPSPPSGARAASRSTATDASDDEDESPQSDERPRDTITPIPFIHLIARAHVLAQTLTGPQRHHSLVSASRRGSSAENNAAPIEQLNSGHELPSSGKSARSFRMSFVFTTGDDGLADLVKNINTEGTDRRTLLLHAALALWEHREAAAALRRWQEILHVSSDSLRVRSEDVNDEARRILHSAESARVATENAAAAAPAAVLSRTSQRTNGNAAVPVKFTRRDLDVLVVWARQLQAKTFPSSVDDTSVREVMKYLRFRHYEDGDALFFEGEVGETFYFLFQGTVAVHVGSTKLQLERVHGTRRTTARAETKPDLTQLGPRVFAYRTGEGFGETAMFTNDAIRTASAVAVSACEVCELPKDVYRRTLKPAHQHFFAQAQKINFVQRVVLFHDWQRARLSAVADVLEKRKLAFGDHVLVEGATPLTACFFVLSGLVKLTKQLTAVGVSVGSGPPLRHRFVHRNVSQRSVELQTLSVADMVALEALVEPNTRATYSAVAASASVELYVLKEADARSVLGSPHSALFQRIRELCARERSFRDTRLAAARHALQTHGALQMDAELLRSQDDATESVRSEQADQSALAMKADATLRATTGATASLLETQRGPYMPHLRTTHLLEFAPTHALPPLTASSRVDHEALNAVTSPRMLSVCAKNFVFANANVLASDFPARLRLSFPPSPAVDRSLVERITALMTPVCPAAALSTQTTASPRRATRRHVVVPTAASRDDECVLAQQMARLHETSTRRHWDAASKDGAVRAPSPAKSTDKRQMTALHDELQATQEAARRLVDDHLRQVTERRAAAPGQPTFLHFF